MSRALRIFQNEYPYHVVTRTNGRLFKFRPNTFKLFIKVLNEITTRFDARIQHFQLMSNHYHLKIHTPKENLNQIMHFLNGQIAKKLNQILGIKGHLWEERYRASIISSDAYAQTCVVYIYNNPVRAGLCERAGDSDLLSTYNFYAKGKRIDFTVFKDEIYLMLSNDEATRRKRFQRLIDMQIASEEVQSFKKMIGGPFIGSSDFIKRMRSKYAIKLRLKNYSRLVG